MTTSRGLFQLGFEISPIILTDGIASLMPSGMLPLVALTQAASFLSGLFSGSISLDLDQFFAHFQPAPGGLLVNNQIGQYPFANQTVAANAIIAQPLTISLQMSCPVNAAGGYVSKFMTMSALKATLDKHNSSGGTYIIATPSFIYRNCIMTALRDTSGADSHQRQSQWLWEFQQPLVTQVQATNVLNALTSKLSAGLPTDGALSGPASAVGGSVSSIITAGKNLAGSAVSAVLGG